MPRYYFNIKEAAVTPDLEGIELASNEEARGMARAVGNELARNAQGKKEITIVVTDEYDNPAFEVIAVG